MSLHEFDQRMGQGRQNRVRREPRPPTPDEKQRLANLIKYGAIIFSTLPILLFYPFLQRYFVKGVMIGAIKG